MSCKVDGKPCNLNSSRTITIGSRKSKLALIQTQLVLDQLKQLYPNLEFVIKTIDTTGDNILNIPLAKIGEKALFTKELEQELLDGQVDLIVHSLKDIPTKLPDKCCIGAITRFSAFWLQTARFNLLFFQA